MFNKILIANRGEIACRIIRACKGLRIKTAAIYSERDKDCLHVKLADESYCIGPPDPAKSYLDIDKIVKVALDCGAEAIHPGYGFMAESPDFAKACEDNNITFIGPPSSVMELLGNKALTRKIMKEAGVPIIPGSEGPVKDVDEAKRLAKEIGYPMLIKAVYGGGGKGIRFAKNADELERMWKIARMEAQYSSGSPEIYIEKYIQAPRHIEFQILADKHGNFIHLGERECSIQRKYQKLLEECPSPAVDERLRGKIGEAAIKAAKAVNYANAGTIEFLLDENKNFYFIEVNKRVQVEHLITELVTGVDIVEEQIKIAAGEKLSFKQNDVKMEGWAIDCRINCENPFKDFMPSPGRILRYKPPKGRGIRIDTAIYEGYEVPHEYDSLISKLAVWGRDRTQAIKLMKNALRNYEIKGISTTIPFHLSVLDDEEFIKGTYNTHFIQKRIECSEVAAISTALTLHLVTQRKIIAPRKTILKSRWKAYGRLELMKGAIEVINRNRF